MNDIERIAFVTAHFEELKGLKIALYGAGLLLMSLMLMSVAASDVQVPPAPLQGINLAGILFTFGSLELESRYRNTFGSLVSRASAATARRSLGMVVIFAMLIGPLADLFYQAQRSGPSIAAVGLAVASLFIVIRDWKWRVHYLVPLTGGIVGAVLTGAVPSTPGLHAFEVDPRRAPAFLVAYALLGFGLIAAGLLDHLLLVTTMRPPGTDEAPRAWRRTRPLYVGVTAITSLGAASALASMEAHVVGITLVLVVSVVTVTSVIAVALSNAIRDLSRIRRSQYASDGFVLAVGCREAGAFLAVSLAALLDVCLVPGARPVATALAFGASSIAIAAQNWQRNAHYTVGCVAGLFALAFMPRLVPSQSFALLVCLAAGALAVEWGIDLFYEMKHANAF